ncbi:RNI-like protein [Durotheca rogersii]|uniref:RNI-like protein n=1 Tax=Durotheca rogersii TaxID=419775 RepID=UPI00221E97AF|nr:RNI-like protein [Durotheca rogersii]KAI5867293.1 RNI-like protein [Durotheca rogersii]
MSRNHIIIGPRSALTDYLASQNISASRIARQAQARREAASTATAPTAAEGEEGAGEEAAPEEEATQVSTRAQKRKAEAEAIRKIKRSKAFARRKQFERASKGKKGSRVGEDGEEDEEYYLAMDMLARDPEQWAPVPGQTENCESCQKRFTVTPYSRAGPQGGLLCQKCGSVLAGSDQAAKKKKKRATTSGPAGGGRRRVQSKMLDGQIGVRSLVTLCVETLANNIGLADDLGDLPPTALDSVARHLSKRRLLNPKTLPLFLQPNVEDLSLYDAARLSSDDYVRIFQTCAKLKNLKLRNAIQFNDDVMKYLIGRHITLESIYLHGANLISQASWAEYLQAKGAALKGLRVYYTDKHFSDEVVQSLQTHCPSLTHLKICHNQQVSDEGIRHIAHLRHLERLSLQFVQMTSTEPYVDVIRNVGRNLHTFSLRMVPDVDDRLLDALHEHCRLLTKLRITHSEKMTDAGFARLFKGWKNKQIASIDLELCRHVDAEQPRQNRHNVGLCSDGFRAMMSHSGGILRKLNVHGCRHISREAFEDVFSADKVYPHLADLEISFCEEVTDFVVGSIFRSCPNLKKLNIFGCMRVKDVRVPKGRILVGMPNAIGMVIEGDD